MNQFRKILLAASMMLAFAASAQPSVAQTADNDGQTQVGATRAEQHLQKLSTILNLTDEQRDKLRPIIQQMLDDFQKTSEDKSLSAEQRSQKMKSIHDHADRQARKFLNQDQKKKLDDLEAQPHHG